jgi:hypothetical protein
MASVGKVNEILPQKQYKTKRDGDMAQVVELLPNIREDLDLLPVPQKNYLIYTPFCFTS